ncbi:MAG: hypothetical protein H0W76_04865 [Pyrinomonadaceae bacterium]|nr:hypothetical protein [Pyrinomonadaceae bacterium]
MGKSVNELHHLFDGLSDLKARAATSKEVTTRRKLKNKIVNGANEFLSLTMDFSPDAPPGSSQQVVEQKLAERRKIQRKAVELREWALHNL